ncbi:hypothetical protein C0Q70_21497 [Pomacea canaliculata]|uniref:Uncharacterized protein n=1 Tax=Pomacea canaliculata TaxID=400727 RepID=A0A2T7NCP4_POMCA|nr:hypothetical protein C0Q70_21497 [Pomacea canaliculata]
MSRKNPVETESPQICSFSALDAAAKRLHESVTNFVNRSVACAKVGDNAVHGLPSFAADGDAVTVTTNRDCAGKDDDSLGDVNALHHLSLMEKPTSVPMHLALVTTNFDPGENSVVAPEASLKSKRVSRTSDSKRVSKAVETSPPDGPSSKQGFPHAEELVDAGSKVNKGSGYSGRRSASPKLKHSKENENRKQKSASPQRNFPAHHQATGVGQECPETEVKVDENQSLLKKKPECDQNTTETVQRGKNDPVLSSNKRKKSAEQKEFVAEVLKTDSTTQKDASRAGDVEVKATVAQVYDVSSKKKTDSAPKKQVSRLPKRSTETLPDNKTADTVTSRSVLTDKQTRKTHHVTGMTSARASMSKVSSSDAKITRSVSDIGTTSLPDPRPEISETSQCVESLATSPDKTAQEHSREMTNAEHLESVALRVEKSGTDYLMCKYLASNTEDTRPSDDDNEEVKGSSQSQTNSAEANRSDKKDNSSKLRARASQGAVTVVTRTTRHSDKSQSAGATKKVSAAGVRANNDTRRQLQRKTAVPPEHGAVVRDGSVDSRYNDDDSMSVISNVSSRSSRSVASNLSAAPSKHRGSFQQQQQHTSSKQVKTRAQLEHDKRTAAVQKMEGRKAAESKKSTECSVAAVPVERGGAKPTSLQVAVKTKTQTTRTEPRVGARADKASTIGEERVKEALRSGEVTSTATETDDKQSQGPSQNAESKQKGPAIKTDSLRGKGPSQKLTSALGQQKTVPAKEGKTKQGSSGHSEDKGRRVSGLSVPASHPHRPDCRRMKFDTHARKVQQTRASGAPIHAASKQRPAISSSPLTSADCAGEKAPRRTNDGRKTLSSSDYTANPDLARAQSQIARSEVAAEKEELHEDGERYEREKAEEFDPSTGTQVSSEFVDIARARKCGGNFEESDIIGKPAATSAVRESYDVETSHEDFEQRKTEPEAAVGPASADVIKESKVSRPPDTEPLHTKMGTYLGLASEHSHRSFESFERSTMQKVCSERLDLDSAIVQPVKSGADVVIRMKEGTGLEAKQAPPISYRMSATSTLTLCASSDSSAQTIQNEGSEISDSESEGSNEYITGDEGDEHAEENESEKDDDKERAEGGDKLKSREAGWLEVGYDKVLYEADATDGKFDNEVLLEAGSNDVYAPTAGLGQSVLKSVSGGMESSCDESRHQRTCTANIAAVEHPNGQISARVDGTGFQSSEISTVPRDTHTSFNASYYGDKPSRPPPHKNLNALSALANFADDSALELSAIYCDVSGEQEERGGERGRDGADRGTLLRDVVDATAPLDIRVLTPESEVKVKDASHELVYYADELRHGNERGDEGVERSGEAASVARKEEEEQDNMRIAFSTSAAGEGLSPQHAASDSSSSSRSSSPFTHCRYAMQAEASTNNGQASTPVQPHVDCESVVVLSAPASKTAKTLTLSFSSQCFQARCVLVARSRSFETKVSLRPNCINDFSLIVSARGDHPCQITSQRQRVISPVSTSSLSPPSSSSSLQIHSRPLASKARSPARPHLPFLLQAPAGASTSTCVGRGPRLEEGRREGLASVLPADTELPSEEPWTNFPAGNAAATGSACLSEQHDAGEEPAPTDSDSSLADIADISAVSEVLVPPSLRGSLSDGDLTVNRAFFSHFTLVLSYQRTYFRIWQNTVASGNDPHFLEAEFFCWRQSK